MADYIIDTNVLLVASAQHLGSLFKDSDVPVGQRKIVLNWLTDFRADRQGKVVLDQFFKIWEEYNHKMTGQDIGLMVATEKLAFARFVDISFDENGHGCLPAELEKVVHDLADRKLVAVALTDTSQGHQSSIVNASDNDWYDWEGALNEAGVVVEHLIDEWCRAKWKEKQKSRRGGHRPGRSRKGTI